MKAARIIPLAVAIAFLAIPEARAQQQEPPCIKDFMPLRQDAEKRAGAIRSAIERKAATPELCKAFKEYGTAEEKLMKFAETNNVWCGIPLEMVKGMKANHVKTVKMRDQVCNGARPGGGGAPPPPSLSDALTGNRMPDASNAKSSTGRGTFDTLTGNPLR